MDPQSLAYSVELTELKESAIGDTVKAKKLQHFLNSGTHAIDASFLMKLLGFFFFAIFSIQLILGVTACVPL